MHIRIILLVCLWIPVACTTTPTEFSPTATAIPSCGAWQSSDENFTCIPIDNGLLIQSGIEQITLRAYEASIVVHGTILVRDNDSLRIAVLEGDAVISARGQNRVVSVGRGVMLTITDNFAEIPSKINDIENLPDNLPLEALARSIDENAFVIAVTPVPTTISVEEIENCAIPDDWSATYIIESGDTLARIANRYEVTVEELAEGNCLTNVSWIIVGQALVVPADEAGNAGIPIETVSIGFRADAYSLEPGACTILRWDAFNVVAILLDDAPVSESSFQEVCPDESTSYTLRVILDNEAEEHREIRLSVLE